MYPIEIGKYTHSFAAEKRWFEGLQTINILPSVENKIEYEDESKNVAVVDLIYSSVWNKNGRQIKLAATHCQYRVLKNDDLTLPRNSDPVYYCMKLIERQYFLFLVEQFKKKGFQWEIKQIHYKEWMIGNMGGGFAPSQKN